MEGRRKWERQKAKNLGYNPYLMGGSIKISIRGLDYILKLKSRGWEKVAIFRKWIKDNLSGRKGKSLRGGGEGNAKGENE